MGYYFVIIIIQIEFEATFYHCVCILVVSWLFTFPSLVIAAKIVEEYGAQATSVTEVFSSKVKMGDL